ncbi:thiol reductant ABC exporter subunit CydD [Liquorilactobacillus sicerae]|uniref:thiol reductant ABC exporter subunit CydD n=1 Tax=Liquorilactobacillus sicerae TaxID=1416943 RepID=UPI0024812C8A|nr:thiol reductant ABC exporter subunit CydD [Liquorilactobacillus sicerae]
MIDKKLLNFPRIRPVLVLLLGLACLQAASILGQACFLAKAITDLWAGQTLSKQWQWIGLFVMCYLLRHLILWIKEDLLDSYSRQQAQRLRQELLSKTFEQGPQLIQSQGTGNMTTMALEGVDQVEKYLRLILSKATTMMIVPWLILAVIWYLDWRSGVFLLIIYPLIVIFMIVLGYAAQAKADRQYHTYQLLSNHFVDSLRGIDTLKYLGLSKRYARSIFKTSERFRRATMSTLKVAILSTFALDFFTTLSIAVVAVLLGIRLVAGTILLFPALTILTLSPEYFLPIRDFSNDYHATLDGKNALTAISQILAIKPAATTKTSLPAWNDQSHLMVTKLDFAYPQQSRSVQQLSFQATGFQKIGIIGLSGSGKSTLINLLGGFLKPQTAQIKIAGQLLTSFAQPDWQRQLIYIPQNPYIFRSSLRDNIAFYQPQATAAQVEQAVKVVGLEKLVAQLPAGLDTQIGEGARALSGGQAQRIALARAFLDQSRKVLLFDEPTAHLDIETEVELKERMLPLMANHLVFFATHRLHWMQEMDWILVIDQGRIVEQGTLAQLQQQNGAFVQLSRSLRSV